jgi:hypothetical protein
MFKFLKLTLCSALILGMFTSQVAWAAYSPSTQAMQTQKMQEQRAEIMHMMDRAEIRDALEEQGVTADEAKARIAMLPPSKVAELKTKLDTIPAGEGAVGAIVGALLIVFFVLLFTDLLGETDAYDFDD